MLIVLTSCPRCPNRRKGEKLIERLNKQGAESSGKREETEKAKKKKELIHNRENK